MAETHPYKYFSNWITRLVNTGVSLLKVIAKSRPVKNFPKAEGNTLLVLGPGPSLKGSFQKNPAYFKNHPSLVVNSFSVTDSYTIIQPKYYAMLDPGIWFGESEVMNKTIRCIQENTTWPMVLFLPREAGRTAKIKELTNPNIRICFINYVVFKGFDASGYALYKRNAAMPQSQNVLVASLFLGVNMGFQKIELFGADHNWHEQLAVREDNVVCLKHVHFYENETQLSYVPFWKMAHSKQTFRMDEAFHAWAKVFYGYIHVAGYAKHRGSRIVNRSEISFIDAFEREAFQ